ncbi:MAG: cell division protein FtsZ [Pseudomonadota bacterium]|nr:cell division protein FtsZ [Pseudomonadota bacterium]
MSIHLTVPPKRELKPRIVVFGIGGAGGNAVNNMVSAGLEGVDFVVANTDAQALAASQADRRIQMGSKLTEGLGAGSNPEVGRQAAEESMAEIVDMLQGSHMAFVTAGMGGGTGTGAAPVIAHAARELGVLTVGVVTKPFDFEGTRRMRSANEGINELAKEVDTLIIIPNQNLFRIANAQTTFAEAFAMADEVLHSGVSGITDLMIKPGLINLDFADVKTIMDEMGKAMMGTGEAEGDNRAIEAAEAAIANPLLDDVSMSGANGLLINISGGEDMTLYEVDEAANRIKDEVDENANIIIGSTFDDNLKGIVRVSVVATGIEAGAKSKLRPVTRGEVINMGQQMQDYPSAETPETEGEGASSELPSFMQADTAPPSVEDVAEITEPEPAAEAPEIAEEADEGELPGFLREPKLAPRRDVSKRSRSFLDRVLGTNRQPPKEESHLASDSIEEAEPLEYNDRVEPRLEETAQIAGGDANDAPAPDQRLTAILDAPEAIPAEQAPMVAAAPTQNEPTLDLDTPEAPALAAKVEMPEPPAPQVSVNSAAPTPTIAEQAPMVQTQMQTAPGMNASYEADQLDIPAFLRR